MYQYSCQIAAPRAPAMQHTEHGLRTSRFTCHARITAEVRCDQVPQGRQGRNDFRHGVASHMGRVPSENGAGSEFQLFEVQRDACQTFLQGRWSASNAVPRLGRRGDVCILITTDRCVRTHSGPVLTAAQMLQQRSGPTTANSASLSLQGHLLRPP